MPHRARLEKMDHQDVRRAYQRWAPVYDHTFGKLVEAGVKQAAAHVNRLSGQLLEVGVGTGLALPHYGPQFQVTGVDLSPHMLAKAEARARRAGKVVNLHEMDAGHLAFADESFDVVVAMFVLTVVPDPVRVMHELARVTKSGGTVVLVNHFSVDKGLRAAVEKGLARHATKLGWRPEFPLQTVMVSEKLKLVSVTPAKPFGFFTMLDFRKEG